MLKILGKKIFTIFMLNIYLSKPVDEGIVFSFNFGLESGLTIMSRKGMGTLTPFLFGCMQHKQVFS